MLAALPIDVAAIIEREDDINFLGTLLGSKAIRDSIRPGAARSARVIPPGSPRQTADWKTRRSSEATDARNKGNPSGTPFRYQPVLTIPPGTKTTAPARNG